MSERSKPVVPEVFIINAQRTYWQLATLGRLAVLYATPSTVRCRVVKGEVDKRPTPIGQQLTLQRTEVYCLPHAQAWHDANLARDRFQVALNTLAAGLRELGSYAQRLEEAGGMKQAPNPLTDTVVYCPSPDDQDQRGGWFFSAMRVPRIERKPIVRHTPKKLSNHPEGAPGGWTFMQDDHFVCPDDAAWERIEALRNAAQQAQEVWEKVLDKLGTYDTAADDNRYVARPTSDAPPPAALVPATPEPPALAGALSEPLQAVARNYLGAKRRMEEALLEAARWLSEARAQCKHGDWGMFLQATRTSEGTAQRLLSIHEAATRSPVFADAVRRGLGATAAAELAQRDTDQDLLEQLLTQETLPTLDQVKTAKGKAKSANVADLNGDATERLRQWNAGEPLRVPGKAPVVASEPATNGTAAAASAPALDPIIGEEGALYVTLRMNEGELRREIVLWRRGPLVLHRGSDVFVISHERLGLRVAAVALIPPGKTAMARLAPLAYWALPGVAEGKHFPGSEMEELKQTLKALRDEGVLLPDDTPAAPEQPATNGAAPAPAPEPAPDPELVALRARAFDLDFNARIVDDAIIGLSLLIWRDGENADVLAPLAADDARWFLDGEAAAIDKQHAVAAVDNRSNPPLATPRPEPRYTTEDYTTVDELLGGLWSDMQADEPEAALRSLSQAARIVVAPLPNPLRARLTIAFDEHELRALAALIVRNGKQQRRSEEGALDDVLDLVVGRLDAALRSEEVEV